MATRREISKIKKDFILHREAAIKSKISIQQEALYNDLVDIFLNVYSQNKDESVSDLSAADTADAVYQLRKAIDKWGLDAHPDTLRDYVNSASSLGDITLMYFATMFDDHAKLEQLKESTSAVINKQLGLNPDGSLKTGGFSDRMISDTDIQNKIADFARKALANGYELDKVKDGLKRLITGSADQNGVVQQHYNTFAKDLLNSVSNNYSNLFAKELGLNQAIYQGGLIKTSHPICIQNNGKIFTRDEIEALRQDPRIIKMYGDNIDDYDPYHLPGGYGCLHSWDWITDDLAGNLADQNKKAAERNAAFKERNGL